MFLAFNSLRLFNSKGDTMSNYEIAKEITVALINNINLPRMGNDKAAEWAAESFITILAAVDNPKLENKS